MNRSLYNFDNKIYSNNNNLLISIVNDLQQVINSLHDNLVIKNIGDVIYKINYIINENKKNDELIMNQFSSMKLQLSKMNHELKQLNINNIKDIKEIRAVNGRYVGQIVNGLREGKGIYYYNNGNRYEGEWRNNKKERKGILYWPNGDRYEGDWRNGKHEGKGIV